MARRLLSRGISQDEDSPVSSLSLGSPITASWTMGKRRDLASIQRAAAVPAVQGSRSKSKTHTAESLPAASPRSMPNGEVLLPMLAAKDLETVRGRTDEDDVLLQRHSTSLPVSSWRSPKAQKDKESLDMLTMRDLAEHLRRCGNDASDSRSASNSTAASAADEKTRSAPQAAQSKRLALPDYRMKDFQKARSSTSDAFASMLPQPPITSGSPSLAF
mmetsp:Transcript_45501/g.106365  ORF Transcript_45501/g.106365 Transcript_45501/m.106365 type:complete len:217 (-) Transcript_45501:105-755(-)